MKPTFKSALSLLFALLIGAQSWAAIRTATQDGNWSNTATWGGAAAPGDGDSAHIPATIDVTVDANTTVGLAATLSAPQASADNMSLAQSAGGSLGAGAYRVFYTNVGAGGESGPSGEATITLTGGNKIDVTMPARGAGVDSRNIYLTDAGGTTFTQRLYATGITGTTTSLSSASWTDGTTTYADAARPPVAIAVFGTLTIADSVSLTTKGDVVMVNAPITGGAGSSFIGNVPASTVYRLIMGTDSGQSSAILTMTGTSGSKATIDRTGTGTWMFAAAGRAHSGGTPANGHGGFIITHTNISDLGSASVNAIEYNDFGGNNFQFVNTIVSNCGQLHFVNSPGTTSKLNFNHITIRGALGTNGLSYEVSGTTPTGAGVRDMKFCVFDCPIRFSMNGFTVEDSLFFKARNHQGGTAASFQRNLVIFLTNSSDLILNASYHDNMFVAYDGTSNAFNNWHACNPSGTGHTLSVTGNIWDCPFSTGGGDLIYCGSGQATVDARNNIVLPDITGTYEAGALLNLAKNAGSTNTGTCTHNTCFAGVQGMMITESAQYAGMFTGCKSNIVWGPSGVGGFIITGGAGTEVEDTLDAANATHNCSWRLAAGTEGNGYDYAMSGVPGANDQVGVDPGFVKADANIKTWGEALGKAGTSVQIIDAVLAELKLLNDPTYNSAFSVTAYSTYIENSMRPTTEALRDAGHDAEDIGAVVMAAAGLTPDFLRGNLLKSPLLKGRIR